MINLIRIEYIGKHSAISQALSCELERAEKLAEVARRDNFNAFTDYLNKIEESLDNAKILYTELMKLDAEYQDEAETA